MPDNSSTAYDDFLLVIDNLKSDFDRAYSDVSVDIEPLLCEVLGRRYQVSSKAIKRAWVAYCDRRSVGRSMLGPYSA